MKKRSFLLLACGLLFVNVQAQITITQNDVAIIGDTIYWAVDTANTSSPPNVNVGTASGTAQNWDFTAIQTDREDTIIYIDPATGPSSNDFPNANLAAGDANNAIYFSKSSTSVKVEGLAGDALTPGSPVSVAYNPPQTVLALPSTMNTTFTSSTEWTATLDAAALGVQQPPVGSIDSVRIKHNSTITSIVDAHGSVVTVSGTFPDCLRKFDTDYTRDSIWLYQCIPASGCDWSFAATVPGVLDENPILDTTYNYSWLANGTRYSIATVETDGPDGNSISAGYKIEMQPDTSDTTSIAIYQFDNNVKIYPNPNNGRFEIKFENPMFPAKRQSAKLEIYNVLGEEIYQLIIPNISEQANQQSVIIDLKSQSAGVYYMQIRYDKGTISKKIIIR